MNIYEIFKRRGIIVRVGKLLTKPVQLSNQQNPINPEKKGIQPIHPPE